MNFISEILQKVLKIMIFKRIQEQTVDYRNSGKMKHFAIKIFRNFDFHQKNMSPNILNNREVPSPSLGLELNAFEKGKIGKLLIFH